MSYDFNGKKALVTGAGGGIGKEIVKHLVKCKAEVTALDIDQTNLNSLKNEISSVHIIHVDLSDWKETRKAVEKLGVVDLLVNNAGILKEGSFEDITEEDFDRLFAINVKPIINVSQIVVKALKEHGKSGSIVNISSATATTYVPLLAAYSASKATIVKLTRTMGVELGPYGIRVNAVNPTIVHTDMSSYMFERKHHIDEVKNNCIPLRKFAEKSDVAAAVLYLLSEEAAMVTGTCLHVDGGQSVA